MTGASACAEPKSGRQESLPKKRLHNLEVHTRAEAVLEHKAILDRPP
jgi:hypothetical protein